MAISNMEARVILLQLIGEERDERKKELLRLVLENVIDPLPAYIPRPIKVSVKAHGDYDLRYALTERHDWLTKRLIQAPEFYQMVTFHTGYNPHTDAFEYEASVELYAPYLFEYKSTEAAREAQEKSIREYLEKRFGKI